MYPLLEAFCSQRFHLFEPRALTLVVSALVRLPVVTLSPLLQKGTLMRFDMIDLFGMLAT